MPFRPVFGDTAESHKSFDGREIHHRGCVLMFSVVQKSRAELKAFSLFWIGCGTWLCSCIRILVFILKEDELWGGDARKHGLNYWKRIYLRLFCLWSRRQDFWYVRLWNFGGDFLARLQKSIIYGCIVWGRSQLKAHSVKRCGGGGRKICEQGNLLWREKLNNNLLNLDASKV